MRWFFIQLATFFGVGKTRPAPGTWGSIVALPIAAALLMAGPFVMMAFILCAFPLCVIAAEVYQQDFPGEGEDSSTIVIDEVLGMIITMVWLPLTWQSFLFGFILFRFLDIVKPFPIGFLDRKIEGGLGVVVDDIAAGIIANLILQLILVRTTWLGVQIVIGG